MARRRALHARRRRDDPARQRRHGLPGADRRRPFFPGSANPDLDPEESLGWDIGLEQPLAGGRLQVGATWFRNDFDNLIQWSSAAQRMENIAEARTDGLEAFLQWLPTAP